MSLEKVPVRCARNTKNREKIMAVCKTRYLSKSNFKKAKL